MNNELKRICDYHFIHELTQLPYIDAIYVFGSRARGDFRQDSDIDLCLVCPRITPRQWNHVEDIIEKADTLYRIDCVRYDTIHDSKFLENIDREKQLIYQRTD